MNVVKKITIAAAFLCTATVANAQDDGLKVGARASYSLQSFGGYKDEPLKSAFSPDMGTVGAGVGLVLSIPAGPISIAPEVAFLYRQNYTMTDKDNGTSDEITQTEFAISIPVLVKWFPIEGLFAQAGVQVDIPIAAELCSDKADKCFAQDGGSGENSVPFERATVDFGIVVGTGYFVTSNFGIDFRYVIGLLPAETVDAGGKKFESNPLHSMSVGFTYLF